MDEIWKDVDNTSGHYQISSIGNLRKKVDGEYITINPHSDSYGYLYVNIKYDNSEKTKHVAIHRLVAKAFVSNPYNLPIVHHIDENKRNNAASNLFWCTHGQNNSFSFSARKGSVIHNRVIEQYSLDGTLLATFPSFTAASRAVGIEDTKRTNQISKCCRNVQKRKSAYGFVWKFGVGDPMYKPPLDGIQTDVIVLFAEAYRRSPDRVKEVLTKIVENQLS